MKPFYTLRSIILFIALLGFHAGAFAQYTGTVNITATTIAGAAYTYLVPTGIYQLSIECAGAAGGTGNGNATRAKGGLVVGILNVTPNQVLGIYVGGEGTNNTNSNVNEAGGGNGTGYTAGYGYYYGGGGGGCSQVEQLVGGVFTHATGGLLIVGGGAGGNGYECAGNEDHGGAGGNATGGTGLYCNFYCSYYCGAGGSQTAGGAHAGYGGQSGGVGNQTAGGNCARSYYDGGGGMGYYGGGGGGYSAGGGGSSYPIASNANVTLISMTQGANSGYGYVYIQPQCVGQANVVVGPTALCTGQTASFTNSNAGGTWSTSNTAVGTIDPILGNFVATGPGTCNVIYTVTLSCGTVASNTAMTVVTPPSSVSGTDTLCSGFQVALFSQAGGVSWTSSNTGVATVAMVTPTEAVVTGISGGTATMTYAVTASCYITNTVTIVAPAPITATNNGCVGYTVQLSNAMTGGTWASNNTAVATINAGTGIATGIATGTNTMTYTIPPTIAPGCYVTHTFTVNPVPAPITGNVSLCNGTTTYLSDPTSGGLATYTSRNPGVATIGSLTGLVTGASVGTTIITYTLPVTGCIATTTETVLQSVSSITGNFNICTGASSTLSGSPAGGSWASSNAFLASIDPVLGTFSGLSAGNPAVSYTLSDGCYATHATTVNPTPLGISGPSGICDYTSVTLTDATAGGTWMSSAPAVGSVSSSGYFSGLATGTPVISYTIPSTGCYVTKSITVTPVPAVHTVSGGGNYCLGGAGKHIMVTGTTDPTVSYNLYNGSALVGSLPGTGGTVDFGLVTAAGTYSVQATSGAGCSANMTGSATIIINPLPSTAFTLGVTNSGNYCSGTTGVDMTLSGSESSANYYLMSGMDTIYTVAGSGAGVDFNPTSVAGPYDYNNGSYMVVAANPTTGCVSAIPGSVSVNVNIPPGIINVTGGGNYCSYAPGVHVGLDYSYPGITYYLYNGASYTDSLPGTSATLSYYPVPVGTYSVVAVNTLTQCSSVMNGQAIVDTFNLPAVGTLSSGGSFCAGSAGIDINIAPTDPTANYQLYNSGVAVGTAQAGTGATLDFGVTTTAGNYTVIATNPTTTCMAPMSGTATVTELPLPSAHPLTGGGVYCAGGAGVLVGMGSSDMGVSYQLTTEGSGVSTLSGTGGALNYGNNTAGVYYVVATNTVTGCSATLPGTVTVTANALPEVYNVGGGGSYCSGDAGLHVGLSWSNTGIGYTLYNGSVTEGYMTGSNSGLDFGLKTDVGNYQVVATNLVTGCTDTMNSAATINVTPTPTSYTLTSSSSSYCTGSSGVVLNLTGSDAGLNYQLYLNGTPVGGAVTGSGSAITFGTQTGVGTYSAIASNLSSLCAANMLETPVITVNPLPTPGVVTGGGQYCAGGTGVTVGLNSSIAGDVYNLYNSSNVLVGTVTGTGSAVSFGSLTAAGTYKATVSDPHTSCMNNESDSAMVMVNALPSADTVTGGGGYCIGSTGVHIGLNTSTSGINYKLYNGSTYIATVSGSTGSPVDFGLTTTTGTYTVVGQDAATGCVNNMYGARTVVSNPLPPVYTMYGGGSYCAGGAGVHVNLSGSTLSTNYQLYYNGVASGSPVDATGAAIDFGVKTAAGNYTVIATNPATNCSSAMTGVSSVNINPVPATYSVTGGGSYCAGIGSGEHVGLSNSTIGINYQLYNGTATVGGLVPGNNTTLDFGLLSAAGAYEVKAINPGTSCTSTMIGTASIMVNPVVTPSVNLSTPPDISLCLGNELTITATPVNGGSSPAYMWYVNGVNVGSGNSYSYVPSNGDMVLAEMISSNACAVPTMASGATVVSAAPYVTPVASIAGTGNITCAGTAVTFTASTSNGGTAPVYAWLKNNIPTGSTGLSYTYTPTNGDVIGFMMTGNADCSTTDLAISNTELMEVNQAVLPSVAITAAPGTTINAGEELTLYANVVNGGAAPEYQWLLNGTAMPGANTATLVSGSFKNGDSVTCVVTNNNACGPQVSSNSVVLTVNSLGVQQLSATGASFTVLPNPNNGTFTVKGSTGNSTESSVTLELTDVVGQAVYTGEVKANNGQINSEITLGSNVANGMYLLNIRSASGNTVIHVVVAK